MAKGALIIVEIIDVADPPAMGRYVQGIAEQIAARGARTLGRGFEVIEGAPQGVMRTVMQWPSVQAYRDWQGSDEYRDLLALRRGAATLNIIGCELEDG